MDRLSDGVLLWARYVASYSLCGMVQLYVNTSSPLTKHSVNSDSDHFESFGGENVLLQYRSVHQKAFFIQRCPVFRMSFIGGSTVYTAESTQGMCYNMIPRTGFSSRRSVYC